MKKEVDQPNNGTSLYGNKEWQKYLMKHRYGSHSFLLMFNFKIICL